MKYEKCKKCGKQAVHLAMGSPLFVGDADDGDGNQSKYADREIDADVSVGIHICFECGELQDVFIENPRDKILSA